MTKSTLVWSAALAGSLALIGTGASFAQQAPKHHDKAPAMHERPDPAAMAQRRADRLRDTLQLTPSQEPALRALVDAMMKSKPDGDRRERMHGAHAEMAKMSTPERLDRMQTRMAERQDRFEARAAAIKRFYAQLTPSQQKAFDAMPHMGGHRGKGGRGGHKGYGGHGEG